MSRKVEGRQAFLKMFLLVPTGSPFCGAAGVLIILKSKNDERIRRDGAAGGSRVDFLQHPDQQDGLPLRCAHVADVPGGRHVFRDRRAGHPVRRRFRGAKHRNGGLEHHPFHGRNGHQDRGNPSGVEAGRGVGHAGRAAHHGVHRPFCLRDLVVEARSRDRFQPDGFIAAGGHHVVHRLGFGVQHPALAAHPAEREPTSAAGAGER